MKNKFVIVDGSSMLSTCYYAVLPREIMFAKTEEEKQKDAEQSQRQEANRLSREVLQEEGLLAGREKQGSARKHRENAPKTSEWRPQNTRYFSQEGQRRIKGEGGS